MKAVLISIRPKHIQDICEQIGEKNGKPLYKKTIEVRKTKPNLEIPFRCLIYATKPKNYYTITGFGRASNEYLWLANGEVKMSDGFEYIGAGVKYQCLSGKVIGEFICDRIDKYADGEIALSHNTDETCLTNCELADYIEGSKAYFWHITDLKIYDKPKELSEFRKYYECGNNSCGSCDKCDKDYHLTRPPQSYMYVEEISE